MMYGKFNASKMALSLSLPNGNLLMSNKVSIATSSENDWINASFDLVIGSIHSVLNMDIERATTRLVKAIENPHMHILGHMTGRLLLSRKGYPVDYDKIFDALAAITPYRISSMPCMLWASGLILILIPFATAFAIMV